jgi:hypothetical protein
VPGRRAVAAPSCAAAGRRGLRCWGRDGPCLEPRASPTSAPAPGAESVRGC